MGGNNVSKLQIQSLNHLGTGDLKTFWRSNHAGRSDIITNLFIEKPRSKLYRCLPGENNMYPSHVWSVSRHVNTDKYRAAIVLLIF